MDIMQCGLTTVRSTIGNRYVRVRLDDGVCAGKCTNEQRGRSTERSTAAYYTDIFCKFFNPVIRPAIKPTQQLIILPDN